VGGGSSPIERAQLEARVVADRIRQVFPNVLLRFDAGGAEDPSITARLGNILIASDPDEGLEQQLDFVLDRLRDIHTMVTTGGMETGRVLMEQVFNGPRPVTIRPGMANGSNRDPLHPVITMTGDAGIDLAGENPPSWADAENTPTDVILMEQLVISHYFPQGIGDGTINANGRRVPEFTAFANGLGGGHVLFPNVNIYRRDRDLELRTYVNSPAEIRDGSWGLPGPEREAAAYAASLARTLGIDLPFSWEFESHEEDGPRGSRLVRLGNMVIVGEDMVTLREQETFLLTILQDLNTAAGTRMGRFLLTDLLTSGLPIRISQALETRHQNSIIDNGILEIELTGEDGLFEPGTPGEPADWQTRQGAPSDVTLVHELIHGFHDLHGMTHHGELIVDDEYISDDDEDDEDDEDGPRTTGDRVRIEEAATVGLGSFAWDDLTENTYRRQRGLPRRNFYTNPDEIAVNGLWGGIDAESAAEWWDEYRAQHAHHLDRRDVPPHDQLTRLRAALTPSEFNIGGGYTNGGETFPQRALEREVAILTRHGMEPLAELMLDEHAPLLPPRNQLSKPEENESVVFRDVEGVGPVAIVTLKQRQPDNHPEADLRGKPKKYIVSKAVTPERFEELQLAQTRAKLAAKKGYEGVLNNIAVHYSQNIKPAHPNVHPSHGEAPPLEGYTRDRFRELMEYEAARRILPGTAPEDLAQWAFSSLFDRLPNATSGHDRAYTNALSYWYGSEGGKEQLAALAREVIEARKGLPGFEDALNGLAVQYVTNDAPPLDAPPASDRFKALVRYHITYGDAGPNITIEESAAWAMGQLLDRMPNARRHDARALHRFGLLKDYWNKGGGLEAGIRLAREAWLEAA
jgi:hypothetical protein